METPAHQVAREQVQQVPGNARLLELGRQPSMPHTIAGSSDVQSNHQGGITGILGVVPGLREEKEIRGGGAFPEAELSMGSLGV